MSRSTKHRGVQAFVTMGLVAAMLVLSPAEPASAESETQTVTIDLSNSLTGLTSGPITFFETSPTFDQFDPATGTLVSATLSWSIAATVNGAGDFAGTGELSYAGRTATQTFDTVTNPGPKTFQFTGSVPSPGTVQGTGTFVPSVFRGIIRHSGFFPWSGDLSAEGTITLVYEYTTASSDTTPPVWSNVPGPITAEATGPSGAVVTYTAPMATDDVGVTSQACAPASGSTFPLGSTPVVCTASDAAGNTATAGFTVTVVDTTAPVWSNVPGPIISEATGPSGAAVSYTAPMATDDVGVTSQACAPASGSTFPLGSTPVVCTALDAAGNTAIAAFTVTVVDTTAPTVVVPASPLIAEATSAAGAAVSFTATASDTVGGSTPTSCNPASGGTFALGSTTVSCSATDAAGNTATASFTVIVRDTTAPVLGLPPSPVVVNAAGPGGATVTYTVTATDAVTASPSVVCSPPSGSLFAIGSSTVSCTATDAAGNQSQGSFVVTALGASGQVANTIAKIQGLGLHPTVNDALVNLLTSAQAEFAQGDVIRACAYMTGFLRAVTQLQARGALTSAQATELTADANRIRAVMTCS